MGYYIQAPQNHGKAEYLIAHHDAEEIIGEPKWSDEYAIICVVDNGLFEAAGYAYSPEELAAFVKPDMGRQRPRTWLKMDKEKARELAGYRRAA